jgi:23S rRNA (pseudouridine1915-N3)-methyltransferase
MRINLVAVGRRMPDWVDRGFSEYAKRLSKGVSLELIEVDSPRRGNKSPSNQVGSRKKVSDCFRRFRKAVIRLRLIKRVVVTTQRTLAGALSAWMHMGRDIALIIGGPEGLSAQVLSAVDAKWSLSSLTLAHPLVRVILAEQLIS